MANRYALEIVAGNGEANAVAYNIHGHNDTASTTYEPVTQAGVYRMPQVGNAVKLRIAAGGDANDTANGTGAREIEITGIGTDGSMITEKLATNGISASANTTQDFVRVLWAEVTKSGSYATNTTGSHAADINIEDSAGTQTWATIDNNGYANGRTEIGCFTVPKGRYAYITQFDILVDVDKTTDVKLMERPGILETSAPYPAAKERFGVHGTVVNKKIEFDLPLGPFKEFTDIFVLAKVKSTTGPIDVTYNVILRDKE